MGNSEKNPGMIYILYLVGKPWGHECFAALIEGLERIQDMSASRRQENYYLEWEEIYLTDSELDEAKAGALVHLVFLGQLTPEDGIKFVSRGQSLALATVDEEKAQQALIRERAIHGEGFVHLWSVPIGWEVPGLHQFLDSEVD